MTISCKFEVFHFFTPDLKRQMQTEESDTICFGKDNKYIISIPIRLRLWNSKVLSSLPGHLYVQCWRQKPRTQGFKTVIDKQMDGFMVAQPTIDYIAYKENTAIIL